MRSTFEDYAYSFWQIIYDIYPLFITLLERWYINTTFLEPSCCARLPVNDYRKGVISVSSGCNQLWFMMMHSRILFWKRRIMRKLLDCAHFVQL